MIAGSASRYTRDFTSMIGQNSSEMKSESESETHWLNSSTGTVYISWPPTTNPNKHDRWSSAGIMLGQHYTNTVSTPDVCCAGAPGGRPVFCLQAEKHWSGKWLCDANCFFILCSFSVAGFHWFPIKHVHVESSATHWNTDHVLRGRRVSSTRDACSMNNTYLARQRFSIKFA